MSQNIGSLLWVSGIDNTGLRRDAAQAAQVVGDIGSTADKVGGQLSKVGASLGDFATQSAKQMKDSIAIQKQAIKELEQEVKKLQQTSEDSTGRKKSDTNVLLGRAKSDLAAEQAALIQMQKAEVAGNAVVAESQFPIIAGLWKWAAGLASVAAAMKIGKQIIESTEATAHKFEQVTTAAASATNYFFQAIASGDWSNFWDGMDRAVRGAVEYVNAMEVLNNKKNEEEIKSSEIDIRIGKNRALTFDKDNSNNAIRKKAYEDILTDSKLQFDAKVELAKQEHEVNLEKAASDSKLSKERIEQFVKEYSSLEKMLKLGEEYNKLPVTTVFTQGKITLGERRPDQSRVDALGPGAKQAGEYVTQISRVLPETRKNLAGLESTVNKLTAGFDMSNFRIKTGLAGLNKEIKDQAIEAVKKAKEAAELENRIKATKEAMNTASGKELKDLAEKLRLLEKELDLRKQIIKAAEMGAWRSQFDGESMTPMQPKGISPIIQKGSMKTVQGILYEVTAIDKTGPTWTKVKAQFSDLKKFEKEKGKEAAKDQEDLDKETAKKKIELQQDIISGARQLTGVLIEQLGLTDQEANALQGMADAMGKAASGDYVGAIVSEITTIINLQSDQKKINDEYYASVIAQQKDYNLLLNDQIRLNSEINGSLFFTDYSGELMSSVNAIRDASTGYNASIATLVAARDKLNESAAAVTGKKPWTERVTDFISGFFGGKPKKIAEAVGSGDILEPILKKYPLLLDGNNKFNADLAKTLIANKLVTDETAKVLQNIIDWGDKLEEAKKQINGVITDLTGSLGGDLRNSLVTAFEDGTSSAIAFGDSVEKVLENILSQMIFNSVFGAGLTKLQTEMYASYGLDADGKTLLNPKDPRIDNNWVDDFIRYNEENKGNVDQLNKDLAAAHIIGSANGLDIFSKNSSDSSGSSTSTTASATGVSASATEDTVSAMVGQVMAIRVDIKNGLQIGYDQRDIMENGVGYLLKIKDNTYNTVVELQAANAKLEIMNTTLKNGL